MTQTARRYALLPLCLVSVTALGACGAPSSGEATSTTSGETVAAATPTDTASATDPAATTDASGATTAAAGTATFGPPATDPNATTSPTSGPSATGAPGTGTTTQPGSAASGSPQTVTVTVTASNGTVAPVPGSTASASTSTTPTASATPQANLATVPASRLGGCHTTKLNVYTMNLNGLNDKARQTAQTVYRAGRVCIPGNLVKVAKRDNTKLAYKKADPATVFAVPQTSEARYDTILKLMGLQSATATLDKTTTYVWPRVVAAPKDDAAWAEVVKVGLISKDQATTMRKGGGYWGPQIWIDANGAWRVFTS